MRSDSGLKAAIPAAGLLLAVVAMVAPVAAAAPITGAEFATLLTNFGNTDLPLTAAEAVGRLRDLGVPLGNAQAPLTEKQLAEIMRYFGVPGTTSNPRALVDAQRAKAAASILSATSPFLAGRESSTNPPSPADISACLFERNRGQCKKCCVSQGSPAKSCATFCQNLMPPSGSEPLP